MTSESSPKTVSVIGAGTMGAGIAQLAATHGWSVFLVDLDRAVLDRARGAVAKQLERQVETGKITGEQRQTTLERIQTVEAIQAAGNARLAIEAVVEDLSVKQKVFQSLEAALGPEAILATNTSSLSVGRIAEGVRRAERVVGMHFFNPAPVMPLVEIIAAGQSDASCVAVARAVAQEWGKVTVLAKDTPGFIVNRVARGFYLEALRLLGEGVAGVDEIDAGLRTHGGFKMGPFQLMDLVGLDVNLAVSTSVWEQMNRPTRLQPHPIQQTLVAQGQLGRKTNRGFYVYDEKGSLPAVASERKTFEISPLLGDAIRTFCERGGMGTAGRTEQYILARILAAVFNEAAFALAENVATAEDIDLAMVKGTNYPKGTLSWAQMIGPRTVRGVLTALNKTITDNRYDPAPLFADS